MHRSNESKLDSQNLTVGKMSLLSSIVVVVVVAGDDIVSFFHVENLHLRLPVTPRGMLIEDVWHGP